MLHSWEALSEILVDPELTYGILCDIGMPVVHRNVRYNCRIFVLNGKILLIRPKIFLANDGNYREPRWFTSWKKRFQVEQYYLPRFIQDITGQQTVSFGEACLALRDTVLAAESCEELFTPDSPHIAMALSGVEIFTNGSGSHHQLRKLHRRVDLMKNATQRCGGVYLYSNHQCCDGGRLYFDGCALIVSNGHILAQGSQFSINEVEVLVAAVDLEAVRSHRGAIASLTEQASLSTVQIPRINVAFELSQHQQNDFGSQFLQTASPAPSTPLIMPTKPVEVFYHITEEEIAYGPACWLWDYLRRSNQGGYFLPLSGGADSSSTAAIVGIMCKLVVEEVKKGNPTVIADARRIGRYQADELPESAAEFCSRIFYTCYMGKSAHSSEATRARAEKLAEEIGATHLEISIDEVVQAFEKLAAKTFKKSPKYKVHGGSATENLALQNIQARTRMVCAYLLAQLSLWGFADCPKSLLVLGSANVDEALRGYLTKYDCSSADVNPIGAISKVDLKKFLVWAGNHFRWPTLVAVVEAPPTAELEPVTAEYTQTDEVDMGMTYAELSIFGRLRKINGCGPVSMYQHLVSEWHHLEPIKVAEKVKRFFFYYSINRHKMTTITPSYHAENYSPDDNRFDLRPFLYNPNWTWQFARLDSLVARHQAARTPATAQVVTQLSEAALISDGKSHSAPNAPSSSETQMAP
jgi:NAD+ synthase (glutamine-hydrolysing)